MIFGREPVAWVGIIAGLVLTGIQYLTGQGVISDVVAGKAVDATNSLATLAVLFIPIILNVLLARPQVTPTADPTLEAGTTVRVTNASGTVTGKTTV